jgi:hypothetical protein
MISLYFEDISDVKVVPPPYPQSKLVSVVVSLVVEGQPLTSTLTINRCEEAQARFLLAKIKSHLKTHLWHQNEAKTKAPASFLPLFTNVLEWVFSEVAPVLVNRQTGPVS